MEDFKVKVYASELKSLKEIATGKNTRDDADELAKLRACITHMLNNLSDRDLSLVEESSWDVE